MTKPEIEAIRALVGNNFPDRISMSVSKFQILALCDALLAAMEEAGRMDWLDRYVSELRTSGFHPEFEYRRLSEDGLRNWIDKCRAELPAKFGGTRPE